MKCGGLVDFYRFTSFLQTRKKKKKKLGPQRCKKIALSSAIAF